MWLTGLVLVWLPPFGLFIRILVKVAPADSLLFAVESQGCYFIPLSYLLFCFVFA